MTAKKKSKGGPLTCDWCPKRNMNEQGLQAHVRQKHPEHHLESRAASAERQKQHRRDHEREKREKRVAAKAAEEAPQMAEELTGQHMHPDIDGGYSHEHQWGDQLHQHAVRGGPPVFNVEAPHPAIAQTQEPEKSEEQKTREHAAALAEAERVKAEVNAPEPVLNDADADIVIHSVLDGFTAFGRVFVHGDNIRIKRGTKQYESTIDPATGKSWLGLSEAEQIDLWGVVKYRPGEFVGMKRNMTEAEYDQLLASSSPEEQRRLEKMRQRNQLPVGAPLAQSNIA